MPSLMHDSERELRIKNTKGGRLTMVGPSYPKIRDFLPTKAVK